MIVGQVEAPFDSVDARLQIVNIVAESHQAAVKACEVMLDGCKSLVGLLLSGFQLAEIAAHFAENVQHDIVRSTYHTPS
ncbi:MAG: hypothetical protein AAF628_34040 [Planctomycetota bacterium]